MLIQWCTEAPITLEMYILIVSIVHAGNKYFDARGIKFFWLTKLGTILRVDSIFF